MEENERALGLVCLSGNDLAEAEGMTSPVKSFQEFAIQVGLSAFENGGTGNSRCPGKTREAVIFVFPVPAGKTI